MSQDATFEEGRDAPLDLGAMDAEDLKVIAALAQDAVFPVTEVSWRPSERRLGVLLNRFRWEDRRAAERRGRDYERVQSLLVVENALSVASQGVDRADDDLVLSLLDISWEPRGEVGGFVVLTLAGDGALRVEVEALELRLKDVTRPYRAPSRRMPDHPE